MIPQNVQSTVKVLNRKLFFQGTVECSESVLEVLDLAPGHPTGHGQAKAGTHVCSWHAIGNGGEHLVRTL